MTDKPHFPVFPAYILTHTHTHMFDHMHTHTLYTHAGEDAGRVVCILVNDRYVAALWPPLHIKAAFSCNKGSLLCSAHHTFPSNSSWSFRASRAPCQHATH